MMNVWYIGIAEKGSNCLFDEYLVKAKSLSAASNKVLSHLKKKGFKQGDFHIIKGEVQKLEFIE